MKYQLKIPQLKKWIARILWAIIGYMMALSLSVRSPLIPIHATESLPADISQSPSTDPLRTGIEHFQAERFTEAIASWHQALSAYTLEEDELHQALLLSNLSLAYQHLGQWQDADDTLHQSLAFFEQHTPDSRSNVEWEYYAKALNAQGWYFWRRGQSESALQAWRQAAIAYESANYVSGLIGSQLNQAKALQSLGLTIAARDMLERTQQMIRQQVDPQLRVMALQSLGNAFRRVGNLDASQKALSESLAIATTNLVDALSSNQLQSSVLLDLGNTERARWSRAVALTLNEADDYQTAALKHYQDAVAIAPSELSQTQAIANLLSFQVDRFRTDLNQARQVEAAQWATVQELWDTLQAKFADLPLGRSSIDVQLNGVNSILNGYAAQEPVRESIHESATLQSAELWPDLAQILARCIQQARQLQDSRAESLALGQLGHMYEQADQWTDAKTVTNQAIALAEAIQAPDISYRWEWQLGRILTQQDKTSEAIRTYDQAVKTLEQVRQDLLFINSDVQFSFRDNVEPLYRQFVDLLLSSPDPPDENLRNATKLIDSLQLAELENYLGCNIDPVQISDRVIDPTAAIVYPIILSDRLEVILQLPDQSLHRSRVQVSKAEVDALTTQLYQDLPAPRRWRSAQHDAKQLYDWMIRPFKSVLDTNTDSSENRAVQTLVFVLDGGLRNLPMAALWDGDRQQYLIERYAIAVAPSLQVVEPKPLTQPIKVLTAGSTESLAHPFRDGNFSPLQNVENELKAIQSLLPTEVLFNETFTKANLERQLQFDNVSIVHLASHGVFSSDPSRTFIALSDDPLFAEDLDNLLRTRDVEGRNVELLVLSACQTATGDDRATLGLAGLTVRAGARSTLATLWSVDDESAAVMMEEFYRQLAQYPDISRAKALHQAQLNLWEKGAERLRDWKRPYFWSPYVLVGNWL
ncbi:MAG: CHAT domain-containing protein [Elainellaceae cyanobacterium]